jgi:hypothetical protein
MGMVIWFRMLIEKFAKYSEHFTYLLRKKVRWCWSIEQENAFNMLKLRLISPPILACLRYEYPSRVQCDALAYAIVGTLTHVSFNDGGEHVINYLSRALTQQERNYSATERKSLAVIFCLEKISSIHRRFAC